MRIRQDFAGTKGDPKKCNKKHRESWQKFNKIVRRKTKLNDQQDILETVRQDFARTWQAYSEPRDVHAKSCTMHEEKLC